MTLNTQTTTPASLGVASRLQAQKSVGQSGPISSDSLAAGILGAPTLQIDSSRSSGSPGGSSDIRLLLDPPQADKADMPGGLKVLQSYEIDMTAVLELLRKLYEDRVGEDVDAQVAAATTVMHQKLDAAQEKEDSAITGLVGDLVGAGISLVGVGIGLKAAGDTARIQPSEGLEEAETATGLEEGASVSEGTGTSDTESIELEQLGDTRSALSSAPEDGAIQEEAETEFGGTSSSETASVDGAGEEKQTQAEEEAKQKEQTQAARKGDEQEDGVQNKETRKDANQMQKLQDMYAKMQTIQLRLGAFQQLASMLADVTKGSFQAASKIQDADADRISAQASREQAYMDQLQGGAQAMKAAVGVTLQTNRDIQHTYTDTLMSMSRA